MYSALAGACKDSIGAKDGKSKKASRNIRSQRKEGENNVRKKEGVRRIEKTREKP